jgi:hypothetical protein
VDGDLLHFIAIRGEMEVEFAQKTKKKGKFCFYS